MILKSIYKLILSLVIFSQSYVFGQVTKINDNPDDLLKYKKLTDSAYSLKGKGDFESAIKLYTAAFNIKFDETSRFDVYVRGICYKSIAKYNLAVADFTKALEINPNYGSYLIKRAETYQLQKKYSLAITDFTEALKTYPESANILSQRGLCYFEIKEFGKSYKDIKKIIDACSECYPKQRELLNQLEKKAINSYQLGETAFREKKYQVAISYLLKAIELMPDDYSSKILLEQVRNAENTSFPSSQYCKDENGNLIQLPKLLEPEKIQVLIVVHSNCNACYNLIDTISKISMTKPNKFDTRILFTEFFDDKDRYFTTAYKAKILEAQVKNKWQGNIYFDTDLSVSKSLSLYTLPKIFIVKNGKPVISDWVGDEKRNQIFALLKKL